MHLLTWNIRGIKTSEKLPIIKRIITQNTISFLGLVETKHKVSFSNKLRRIWANNDCDWCESLAAPGVGSIIIIWDIGVFVAMNRF